jgi:hypothetical protein
MGIPNATHNTASNAIAALGNWISLHTAAAGTTGASEATGGTYARKSTTWTSTGAGANNGSVTNIPAPAGTYVEAGIFSAVTAGTFVGSAAFSGGNVIISGSGGSIDVTPSITA